MRGIRKEYYGNVVLDDVELTLQRGEIHALLGENGAGKSTLMNILFGMPVIRDTGGFQGDVRLQGEPVSFASPEEAMASGVGMVHQEFMLIPGFTVAENIKLNREPLIAGLITRRFGRRLQRLDREAMTRDARNALQRIHLDLTPETLVSGLPVGHMQFVEIAREVDKDSLEVLVFDEPTAVLTESEAKTLLGVMRELADQGIAILFITHRLDEVMCVADRVTILRDGRRVWVGAREETSVEHIAETMVGRALDQPGVPASASGRSLDPEIALSVRDLRVDMSGEQVRGLDLDVHRGEILGIGGLAGQGKIGIANGLMGLQPATGTIRVGERALHLNDPRESLGAGMAFVSEDRRGVGLILDESIEQNIAIPGIEVLAKFVRGPRQGFGSWLAWLDRAAVRAHAETMIDRLDVRTTGPTQPVGRLSGGNQQKVCLARAMVLDPEILLVSEPTRGIDVGAKKLVLDLLIELNREKNLTIVMTSSELLELRSICDRIAIVSEGKVAGILPPDAPDVRFGLLMSGEAA
ncbi:MAG: sugar ABC transporter ATP-binding protein [Planctomycetes bacterium]|nr:sugar ABC transporter ATP-binding protein [Planctomycetota bacterium]